jgi:hypothetical protein
MVVLNAVQILTYFFFWVIVMPDKIPMKIIICNMVDLFILADIVLLVYSDWKLRGRGMKLQQYTYIFMIAVTLSAQHKSSLKGRSAPGYFGTWGRQSYVTPVYK